MAEKIKWTDFEMMITLAFYTFTRNRDDKKKIKAFTKRMNNLSGIKRSANSVGLRIANYKAVDPKYVQTGGKGMSGGGKMVNKYFDEYVTNEPSLETLANAWSNFLNGESLDYIQSNKYYANQNKKTSVVNVVVFNRSEKVKDITLKRAEGICELCGNEAPFITDEGKPYLEVHHIVPLSEGGKDTLFNTIALCPNCHRKLHYSKKLTVEEKQKINEIKSSN